MYSLSCVNSIASQSHYRNSLQICSSQLSLVYAQRQQYTSAAGKHQPFLRKLQLHICIAKIRRIKVVLVQGSSGGEDPYNCLVWSCLRFQEASKAAKRRPHLKIHCELVLIWKFSTKADGHMKTYEYQDHYIY